jgi:hypothetical protein
LTQGYAVGSRAVASAGAIIEANGPAPSIARYTFSGVEGVYDIGVGYYDENDGIARMEVWIDGVEVDDWFWNQDLGSPNLSPQTLTERSIQDVVLRAGDVIELRGFRDGGFERVRTDYLDFAYIRPVDDVPPPPVAFRVEAEAFQLVQNFAVATRAVASGGAVIESTGAGAEQIARYTFAAADGVYDLAIGYYDENDGVARMEVWVDGVEVDDWLWSQDLGSPNLATQTLTERIIAGVELQTGDVIELRGFRAAGEPVRTDYIDFLRLDDPLM